MEGKTQQLRSYIAPGVPATRRPCDGTEPDFPLLRISVSIFETDFGTGSHLRIG